VILSAGRFQNYSGSSAFTHHEAPRERVRMYAAAPVPDLVKIVEPGPAGDATGVPL
jgi:hypothetical protein